MYVYGSDEKYPRVPHKVYWPERNDVNANLVIYPRAVEGVIPYMTILVTISDLFF